MLKSDTEEDTESLVHAQKSQLQQTPTRKQSFSLQIQQIDSSRNYHSLHTTSRKVSALPAKSTISRRYSNNSDPKSTLIAATNTLDTRALIRYENTYKLGPDSDKEFNYLNVKERVFNIIKTLITNNDITQTYNYYKCVKLCQRLSDHINQEIKKLSNPRHKLITIVFCGEKNQQEIRVASRCLWDTRYDNCVSIEYENKSFFVIANVYGLYFE
jgi:tctex1 domain-containing protein 2